MDVHIKKIITKIICISMVLCSVGMVNRSFNAAETAWDFEYTGNVEEFTAPYTGKYFIDCYGGQGGGLSKGGQASAYMNLYKGEKLYICVGEKGIISSGTGKTEGGYNGGGAAYFGAGTGGGATSVTIKNRGELKNFKDNKDEVALVAAGAGGKGSEIDYINNKLLTNHYCNNADDNICILHDEFWYGISSVEALGSGGGTIGNYSQVMCYTHKGGCSSTNNFLSKHGNEYSGFSFGQGGDGSNISNSGYGGAGGGGYYGGFALSTQTTNGDYYSIGNLIGAGGSSYGSDKLTYDFETKVAANSGNGHCRIEYKGNVTQNIILDMGDIGTINGENGTITISGTAGDTGEIPQVILKDGYKIAGWKIEYGEIEKLPSQYNSTSIHFKFGDVKLAPDYIAPLQVSVDKISNSNYS